ncbi:DNA primase regulatory subunit PriL [Halococcus agarilyticus]|uniref:DNA primase regulatory subunit PriL n=1 Tax=Halococcus agarilyticus TaxID=1232219 RepID=UPI000677D810|nr:DNA primase regulatory subunit PriL [Halococcus agarilyticus]
MERRHARYPFLDAAREAVERADVDLLAIARDEERVVDRATERVERALTDGTIGDPRRSTRVELLSYPLARVLVSLVDEHVLIRKYARAEASAAHERFETAAADAELKSTRDDRVTTTELLAEFDLARHVHAVSGTDSVGDGDGAGTGEDAYRVDVGAYLGLAADMWGDEWRLVNRTLAEGRVPITHTELGDLLEKAIERRIADGLPLTVPESVGDLLEDAEAGIRETLSELELTREIDTVVPDLFPPCMRALLDSVRKGEHLEHHSRFAITAFLTSIGMTTDEIVEFYSVNPGFGEEMTRYQTDHIRGETSPTEYSPPSCATMQSYGDCVNMDDRCETISHPMAYYEGALDDADDDEIADWRETEADADA